MRKASENEVLRDAEEELARVNATLDGLLCEVRALLAESELMARRPVDSEADRRRYETEVPSAATG